ncbi:hypothetical protein NQ318_002813 [Aromia moschata]|uniref:C2H2-type domain-containing protein n=1 Tax=Aromia moschata TaxID=1265417 RepID=A0AAV8XRK3_9CUCU|nr:hypothetical protein NQ318_002813 [Aromia moschata]
MGEFLGEITDELESYGPGSYITEFVSGGPKKYAYRVFSTRDKEERVVCKVKASDMFTCKICTAAFTCRSSLSRHVNAHKEKNIVCVLCDGAFTRRDSLNAHIKTIHKGHLTDNRDAFTRASNDYYDETSKQPADKEDVLEREMCLYEDDYEDPNTLVDDLRYYIVERRLSIEHHVCRDIIKKLQNMGIIA